MSIKFEGNYIRGQRININSIDDFIDYKTFMDVIDDLIKPYIINQTLKDINEMPTVEQRLLYLSSSYIKDDIDDHS